MCKKEETGMNVLSHLKSVEVLRHAETIDHYIAKCKSSFLNTQSRKSYYYFPKYIQSDDADSAKQIINGLLIHIHPHLKKLIKNTPIFVILMNITAENGMPHTRSTDVICLPHSIVANTPSFLNTIEHELWHIHQKKYNAQWEVFFTKHWHFKKWGGKLPDVLEDKIRFNPDTVDAPLWVWNDTWVPIPIFTNITSPTLSDTDVWFYNIDSHRVRKEVPPNMLSFFSDNLPKIAYEHPREISAYLLSSRSNKDKFHYKKSPAYNNLYAEFE